MQAGGTRPSDRQEGDQGARPRQALRQIDFAIVRQMERRLHSRKPEHIMEKLGISLNTWDKLRVGEPIRASTARRLLDRFGKNSQSSN